MQKKQSLFIFCRMGGTLPPPGIRALRARHARLRAWRSGGGGRAAAADRDAKEKTNKFFLSNTCLFQKQKQSYLTVIVGLQDGKIRFK